MSEENEDKESNTESGDSTPNVPDRENAPPPDGTWVREGDTSRDCEKRNKH
jgi:hypothetical protein